MRVDKFLKVSRIIKRRTVAAGACDGGRVMMNGKEVKPGHKLKVGDVVTVEFGKQPFTFRVKELKETVKKDDAHTLYEVVE